MGYMRAHTVTSRYVHKAEPIHKDVQCSAAKLYKMMLKMNNVIIHPKEMGIWKKNALHISSYPHCKDIWSHFSFRELNIYIGISIILFIFILNTSIYLILYLKLMLYSKWIEQKVSFLITETFKRFFKYFCDAYYVQCGYEKKENEFPFISVV